DDPRLGGGGRRGDAPPDRLRRDPGRGREKAQRRGSRARGGRRRVHRERDHGGRFAPDVAEEHLRGRRRRRGGALPASRGPARADDRPKHPRSVVQGEAGGRGHSVVYVHVAGGREGRVERDGGGEERGRGGCVQAAAIGGGPGGRRERGGGVRES